MRKFCFSVCLAIACVFMLSSDARAAAFNIDTFNGVSHSLMRSAVGTSVATVIDAEAIGGERDLELHVVTGSGVVPLAVTINDLGSGLLEYFEPNGDGFFRIVWDGVDGSTAVDPLGLGGVDLTVGSTLTGIQMGGQSDTSVNGIFTVYTDAGNASAGTLAVPALPSAPLMPMYIDFSSFTPILGAGADFTNVGAIVFEIDLGQIGTDLKVDFLESNVNPVPEPSSFALLCVGLIGLAGVGRVKRRRVLTQTGV